MVSWGLDRLDRLFLFARLAIIQNMTTIGQDFAFKPLQYKNKYKTRHSPSIDYMFICHRFSRLCLFMKDLKLLGKLYN